MTRQLTNLLLAVVLTTLATAARAESRVILPKHRLAADELAVIVNDADPLSRQIAHYYRQRRRIPEGNLIHISFDPGRSNMGATEFITLKR
ncbi:MAG TPA: TIGR03790 family protein, partial [Gammaproteobacteria bacterium]